MRGFASAVVATSVLGLAVAFSSAASAAQHKWCSLDAKTGKPVPYSTGATQNDKPHSGQNTRVACPSPARSAKAGETPLEPGWLLSAKALLVKAPPPPAAPTWWVSAGALIWAVKSSAPLPPTLTTFVPGSLSAVTGAGGELGVPGTIVLSPANLQYDPFPGGQFTLGHWLDPNQSWGVEGSGFFLDGRGAGFSDTSGGTPPLRIPFTNVPPGAGFPLGPSSFILADPGFAAGGQVINSSLQFWGAEGNPLFHAINNRTLNVTLLAGVRYLDLRESLSIASTETLLPPSPFATFTGTDSFATQNQFFGAQVGAKAEMEFGRFDGTAIAKVALGDNYQTVSINGMSSTAGVFGTGTTPGGIFAQSTNIGTRTRNQFAAVPEVQLQLGYKVTSAIHVFVGYDFLYMSSVVRPGDQIDTTLNVTGNPAIAPGTTLTGAARPAPLFNNSGFWAQGVNFRVTYDF